MKHILAVIYCYPPMRVPATMCYVKLLIGLTELGYSLDVLTLEPSSRKLSPEYLDATLCQLIPEGVANHEIRTWESNRLLSALKRHGLSYTLLYKLFEPSKKEWTYPVLRYLHKMDLDKYELVLSCSQPHANHLVGLHLKEMTGKPWIAYFSDPWVDNVYAHYRTGWIHQYNRHLEQKIVTNADCLLFTSEEMQRLVMKKYSAALQQKAGVIPHCFIPEWYSLNGVQASPERTGKVKILHTGSFYGPRTPLPLFRVLEKLHGERSLSEQLEFIFYGEMENHHKEFLQQNSLQTFVSLHSAISYTQSLSMMKEADYLLLIDAPLGKEEESVFLPSKLIDYLGSGTPIIGITPERGASARVLKETGNIVCPLENEERLSTVVRKAAHRELPIPKRDKGAAYTYHYKTISKRFSGIIERTCV